MAVRPSGVQHCVRSDCIVYCTLHYTSTCWITSVKHNPQLLQHVDYWQQRCIHQLHGYDALSSY